MNTDQNMNPNNDWIEPNPFSLDAVISSKASKMPPQRIIIYGTPGIGKTTFASTFEKPILLRLENGASTLDIPTFPNLAATMQELDDACRALRNKHEFKTLIIDSLDWLEPIVWSYVCQNENKANIEDFGYGKGYIKTDDIWKRLRHKLDYLCDTMNMNIVVIAHAAIVNYDPPDMESYQRYSLKLHKRASAIWTEWADMLLFVNHDVRVIKEDSNKKGKATGLGNRIVFTQERPAYQAKNRWGLPSEIDIGDDVKWSIFHETLKNAVDAKLNKENR
jgi:hypothetical protein